LVPDAGQERPGRAFALVDVLEKLGMRDVCQGAEERDRPEAGVDIDVTAVGLLG
jgi:hypothetical protein